MSASTTASLVTATFRPNITATAAIGSIIAETLVLTVPSPSPSAKLKAASQSLLDADHTSPVDYDPSDPIVLFIIQASFVIILSRLIGILLARLRQPRVISEVIAGIVLGPSVFGQIPNFTNKIFPSQSLSYLNLVSTIGLVLFLFLVGIEVDFSVFRKNAKASLAISAIGMVIPFGLGCAVAIGIYDKFIDANVVSFSHFMLFVGVAMAITAFPVLARILTELRLLTDEVGLTTLAAGVGNDVVGWILLALAVTLVNAGSGVTAVYVLLVAVGWTLFLLIAVKPVFLYLVRKSGSFEQRGPTPAIMTLTILLVFASAWMTQVIGIHAIFGGFLVGLIMPKEHGFTQALIEKIEDLVTVLFIPIYFALSGLNTDLSLLKNGSIWGWTVCIIVVAFTSKFFSCAIVARLSGFKNRESLAIGSLMSCKGLVELIVLNIGLSAGILNPPVFAMFVVMALVTTFATTPLTLAFYPDVYRQRRALERAGQTPDAISPEKGSHEDRGRDQDDRLRTRFAVILDRLEHLPSMMALIKLLQLPVHYGQLRVQNTSSDSESIDKRRSDASLEPVQSQQVVPHSQNHIKVDALRLLELTERTSAVMKASTTEETARSDPILNIFKTFTGFNGISTSTSMEIVPHSSFAPTVASYADDRHDDMILIPWSNAGASDNIAQAQQDQGASSSYNPFEGIFSRSGKSGIEASPHHAAFIRQIFAESRCDVGLFLDRGLGSLPDATSGARQHILLLFCGGSDDRAALELVVQLCRHPGVSATVIRILKTAETTDEDNQALSGKEQEHLNVPGTSAAGGNAEVPVLLNQMTIQSSLAGVDTVYGHQTTATRMASDTADNIIFAHFFPTASSSAEQTAEVRPTISGATLVRPPGSTPLPKETLEALAKIKVATVPTAYPLRTLLERARTLSSVSVSASPLLVITGRSRRDAPSHREELATFLKERVASSPGDSITAALGIAASSEVRKMLGDIGSALVASGINGSLLVLQAGRKTATEDKKDA